MRFERSLIDKQFLDGPDQWVFCLGNIESQTTGFLPRQMDVIWQELA